MTVFVCVILASGALLFSNIATELVITPIETMMEKVNKIAIDPLQAAQTAEDEALAIDNYEQQLKAEGKWKPKKHEAPMETVLLEQTITKIGGLLAIGFGEAGSKIISQNMSSGGDINPMIAGNKIIGIFGFCDIRNFTDATECLQEGVMLFVNEIGEIVHGVVDQYSGAANKNIGDAFLLAWKVPDSEIEIDEDGEPSLLEDSIKVAQLCDMAVLSFVKIIADSREEYKLLKYRHNPALTNRMPGYSVKMGYGMHIGWAIEGAIGSFYKIDASYLSPHVNMSSKLEESTKAFGVPLLITGELRD